MKTKFTMTEVKALRISQRELDKMINRQEREIDREIARVDRRIDRLADIVDHGVPTKSHRAELRELNRYVDKLNDAKIYG